MVYWWTEKGCQQEPGGFWDQQILKDIGIESYDDLHIVAGRYYESAKQAKGYKQIITGDEEGVFPYGKVAPDLMWVQSPPMTINKSRIDRFFPIGYPPHTREILKKIGLTDKPLRWFISAQDTHKRRKECFKALEHKDDGILYRTKGFTQGLPQKEYLKYMADAKVAPCPSGAVIPDSFRLYEALEAQAFPIVDGRDPKGGSKGYWDFLFDNDHPLKVLDDWADLPGTIDYFCDTYPYHQNIVSAWWQKYKRDLKHDLREAMNIKHDDLTVIIPTSVIPSHPSTEIIEQTIESIRHFLPETEIIITIDGLREEQRERRDDYEEYKRRLLWKCNLEWDNITPIVFEGFSHQMQMLRETLKQVHTPNILYVEHDTPLTTDCEIPFEQIIAILNNDDADLIRLNHEAMVHPDHEYLYLDSVPFTLENIPVRRTAQWSQRPHIAKTEYYKRILDECFNYNAKTMIEDRMHGVCQEKYDLLGKAGWNQHRLLMYAPEGNQKRSYTTDGRQSDPKFEMIWE